MMRIPRICNARNETTVWAHLNGLEWGKAMGKKGDDPAGGFACSACHDVYDGRVPSYLTLVERENWGLRMAVRTNCYLHENNLVRLT